MDVFVLPAGVTTSELPPGVVDRDHTSTELLFIWAPEQPEKTAEALWQELVAAKDGAT
ncbi:hypothetical protein [Aurantimicrobium minutum]|uniref:hypothetical protein n=1 Tax=Aurantimicrobium minutum TaxID=708131 RepID=UPI00248DA7F4|nr:hypothetical protein [Aurantimicrobium minutum]